jgi:hypothetical protein
LSTGRRHGVAATASSIRHGSFLLSDVPSLVWEGAFCEYADLSPLAPPVPRSLAAAVLEVARDVVRGDLVARPCELDPWACLTAALVAPVVLFGIPAVLQDDDRTVLAELAERLAEPAASVCRRIVAADDWAA